MSNISAGDMCWTANADCDVYEGTAIAVGPSTICIQVTGPFSNINGFTRIVASKLVRPGHAPRMQPKESFMDHGWRCWEILKKPDDVKKLEAEAARLGMKVVPR